MPSPAAPLQTATAEFLISVRQAAQTAQVRRLLRTPTGIDATDEDFERLDAVLTASGPGGSDR